jgi:hypothetical protein
MSNQLTPALLAAAFTAMLNLAMGAEPVSWNIFLAAAVAIAFNIDLADSRVSEGTPVGHSLGIALLSLYLAGMAGYILVLMQMAESGPIFLFMSALGIGALAHVLAEFATGQTVFTFPRNLNPLSWVRETDSSSDRFWSGWGRLALGPRHLGDSHLNALSIAAILGCIWVG